MEKTMIQQLMTQPGVIEYNEVPVPEVKANDVIVKMKKIGICGSDIHVYHGKHPFTPYPVTQGHEVSAEVIGFGENVTAFHVGQKVTIEPQVFCGECYPCRHGKYNLCEELKVMGFQTIGMASTYFVVDQSKVTALPDEMSFDEGAMIEPLAVTVHAARRAGEIEGKKFVVLGTGPIGILLMMTLKAMGAAEVMVTDVSDFRLKLALDCGADYAINTRNKDFNEALVECMGKDKADVIYDCAGSSITMNQAIRCARKGSKIILVAVFADMATVDLAVLNDHELDLDTSMMYRHEDYVEAIKLVGEGKVKLQPLMTQTFAFRDFKAAYEYIDNNRETTMKVLIDVEA